MERRVEVKDGVALCIIGDTLISLWKEPATVERCRSVSAELRSHAKKFSDGFIWFHVILSSSSPPDRAARAEISASMKEVRSNLRKLVVVPLGDTVWHSVVRAIVRTMALLTGMSAQQVVSSTASQGLSEVSRIATAATPPSAELAGALRALCDGLGVDPALAA